MGSEKKRKHRDTEGESDRKGAADSLSKSERKKARKAAKLEAKAAEAISISPAVDGVKDADANVPVGEDVGLDSKQNTPVLLSPIASPMADSELSTQVLQLASLAAKGKALRRGIKEVVLALRKGDKGVCVLAGDVFPVEVIAHVPLLCEEAMVPYCYIQRKSDLGQASLTRRPTSVVLISEKAAGSALSEQISSCKKKLSMLHPVF